MRLRPVATQRTVRPVETYASAPLPALTLVEVLAEARAWQPEAETVIELCVAAGGKTSALARRTRLVATVYGRLRDVARGLPGSAAQREALQLLTFHHRLVHEALQLGYRPDSVGRERAAAHFRGGLGGPGGRLVALYIDVACHIGSDETLADQADQADQVRRDQAEDLAVATLLRGKAALSHPSPRASSMRAMTLSRIAITKSVARQRRRRRSGGVGA